MPAQRLVGMFTEHNIRTHSHETIVLYFFFSRYVPCTHIYSTGTYTCVVGIILYLSLLRTLSKYEIGTRACVYGVFRSYINGQRRRHGLDVCVLHVELTCKIMGTWYCVLPTWLKMFDRLPLTCQRRNCKQ